MGSIAVWPPARRTLSFAGNVPAFSYTRVMALTRRSFLQTTSMAAAFAAPLQALGQRLDAGLPALAAPGYGPLRAVKDATTGLPLLELPEGFRYLTFGWTGDALDDGRRTPPLHDGMAAFAGDNGRVVLVRNHEVGPAAAFGEPAYDPQAGGAARAALPSLSLADDPYSLAQGAESLVLVTEWPEFLALDWGRLKQGMRRPVMLDGRNALDREKLVAEGFEYLGMGR